jgi:hypothetical protein
MFKIKYFFHCSHVYSLHSFSLAFHEPKVSVFYARDVKVQEGFLGLGEDGGPQGKDSGPSTEIECSCSLTASKRYQPYIRRPSSARVS